MSTFWAERAFDGKDGYRRKDQRTENGVPKTFFFSVSFLCLHPLAVTVPADDGSLRGQAVLVPGCQKRRHWPQPHDTTQPQGTRSAAPSLSSRPSPHGKQGNQ